MWGVTVGIALYFLMENGNWKWYNQNSIYDVVREEFHENNYYYSAYTISSPYKWYGWLLDRLGTIRIRSRAG